MKFLSGGECLSTIPFTITPDAAAYLAEIGMKSELDCMIDHTLKTVPGLQSIEVQLGLPYDTGDVAKLIIEARRAYPGPAYGPTDLNWAEGKGDTFPSEVGEYFILMSAYETTNAR